ncbi:hypothetical protein NHX12_027479 [Muraenolepis orangiensis]|uniref:Uncharacterized protein n=1 Tax=Muraenolepis orangiensis TaxID=630683 RepID=A0A9Q0EJ27_9TELE|nr:hypothetical protein NHX12_027479 [Muraenolepis orangiensis]
MQTARPPNTGGNTAATRGIQQAGGGVVHRDAGVPSPHPAAPAVHRPSGAVLPDPVLFLPGARRSPRPRAEPAHSGLPSRQRGRCPEKAGSQ